jgi:hypothetical protein
MQVTVTDFSPVGNDPTNGIVIIPLSSTVTNVTPGDYFYDIQVKFSNGDIVSTPVHKLTINGDITRRVS